MVQRFAVFIDIALLLTHPPSRWHVSKKWCGRTEGHDLIIYLGWFPYIEGNYISWKKAELLESRCEILYFILMRIANANKH